MLILTVVAVGIVVLFLLGIHVAVALGILSFALMYFFSDRPLWEMTALIAWNVGTTNVLVAVPMFIFMGELLLRGGLTERLYNCFSGWFNWLPGGLLQSNIATCAAFASISGSTAATAATISRVAIPVFRARGYSEPLVVGSLAGGGTLGILIPPSIILIVYGVLAEESIGALYMAGVFPGLMLTLMFMLAIFLLVTFWPSLAPREATVSWRERLRLSVAIFPVAILIFLVLGTIYMGIATPTEAASLGVVGAFVLASMAGKVNRQMLKETFLSTVNTTAMVMLVVSAAFMLTFVLAILGVPNAMATAVAQLGWSPLAIIGLLVVFYLVLGTFMDAYSMIVTTVPVILPLVKSLGIDLIWFGILMTLLVEVALISPPHGLNLFILHNVRMQSAGHDEKSTITDLYLGVIPFVGAILAMILLLVAFPGIATWLPTTMR
ncbi:MAG TPA: TRAP transporter large permease subunit [Burkholderiales bacterium]|nr:TRAP transporter large permease subunit [Burkholderiales bacterium]